MSALLMSRHTNVWQEFLFNKKTLPRKGKSGLRIAAGCL
jgi:hypothetical protein